MRLSTAVLALSCATATLTGCTSSKSSPERHAYAFVAHRSDFVGGNFTVNRRENYRLNLPTFKAMYARGQQDKAAGMSESDARRTAEAINSRRRRVPAPSIPLPATPATNGIMRWKIKTPSCSATRSPVPISTAILG